MLKAARLGDQISHTQQRSGLIGGMILGALLVGAVLLTVATGGTALFVIGAVATGAAVGGGIGRWWGSTQTVPKGNINKAATTVFINSRSTPAARACVDTALCQDHTLKLIATGSTTVAIEGHPAARVSDLGACSFKISQGSDNVFIGGETGQCAGIEITPEVEAWLENLHLAVGLIGSFCLGYGPLGWAGSALMTGTGLGGSMLGSHYGGKYFGKWGAIGGGILGGILGGGFGAGFSRGLGRSGFRGFQSAGNLAKIQRARQAQTGAPYGGQDNFSIVRLNQGDIIYGGYPGQSAFYTNAGTVRASGMNSTQLWESLQVAPNPIYGYRPQVRAYRVLQDIEIPGGQTTANPHLGTGGGTQYFIEDFGSYLQPGRVVNLGKP